MKETANEIVDAIHDLTRVIIALNGSFATKSEAIRKLHQLAIPTNRIASILAMSTKDVASAIAKDKKKASKGQRVAADQEEE